MITLTLIVKHIRRPGRSPRTVHTTTRNAVTPKIGIFKRSSYLGPLKNENVWRLRCSTVSSTPIYWNANSRHYARVQVFVGIFTPLKVYLVPLVCVPLFDKEMCWCVLGRLRLSAYCPLKCGISQYISFSCVNCALLLPTLPVTFEKTDSVVNKKKTRSREVGPGLRR